MDNQPTHQVDLKSSNIVIAIAQLAGPIPDGKHKAVVNDRETLAWKSLDDMKARREKVLGILDELADAVLKPDLVVFPEYSFPVLRALPDLQRKADEHNFSIVGGADSVWQPGSADIY